MEDHTYLSFTRLPIKEKADLIVSHFAGADGNPFAGQSRIKCRDFVAIVDFEANLRVRLRRAGVQDEQKWEFGQMSAASQVKVEKWRKEHNKARLLASNPNVPLTSLQKRPSSLNAESRPRRDGQSEDAWWKRELGHSTDLD